MCVVFYNLTDLSNKQRPENRSSPCFSFFFFMA